jgi:hypothetical protein
MKKDAGGRGKVKKWMWHGTDRDNVVCDFWSRRCDLSVTTPNSDPSYPSSTQTKQTITLGSEVKFMTPKCVAQVGTGLLTGSKPHTSPK